MKKWERFETNKETVVRYLFQTGSSHERYLSFSSLESLSSELEQTKACNYYYYTLNQLLLFIDGPLFPARCGTRV